MTDIKPTRELSVAVGDAAFPKPFYQGLEFNAPVHGSWNIVHIGMLLPEARQIYVCADNCMRGVVLTAAEMNASDRFSFVLLDEEDMTLGSLEEATIEGVSECLNKLKERPPVVLLFTVCVHHFLGCDLDYVYKTLSERYPDIFFCRCYMDPLLQKTKPTPDQKLRLAMYDPIKKLPPKPNAVGLIGSELRLNKTSDLYAVAELMSDEAKAVNAPNIKIKELATCTTYKEFLGLGESSLFIAVQPGALMALKHLGKRLERPFLYLPACFGYDEIEDEWYRFSEAINGGPLTEAARCRLYNRIETEKALCDRALSDLRLLTGDTELRIDYTFHPRPLGLARLLTEHGFYVSTVYIDVISSEEEADFNWLKAHAPRLRLCSCVQVEARVAKRSSENVLAIGQKAAWFSGTRHFVNAVGGAGLFGFDGIRETVRLIGEAYNEEKETESLVIQKGWGCFSCV